MIDSRAMTTNVSPVRWDDHAGDAITEVAREKFDDSGTILRCSVWAERDVLELCVSHRIQ